MEQRWPWIRGWGWASVREASISDRDWMLGYVIELVRWVTILALFFLSLAQPLIGRLGEPTWLLILGFAGYSAIIRVIQRRVSWLQSPTLGAILDLIVVSALYTIGASPDGPLFVLFLLVTVRASRTGTLLGSLLRTLAALLVLLFVSPTLPLWTGSPASVRNLLVRLIIAALAGIGTALLMRQLKQAHATAREAMEVAKRHAEYIQQHEEFVASISHELRTPLTAVRAGLGMLEVSLRDRMREDEAHLLSTARRNGERLGLLVNDLLTYNQLEADALQLEHETLDLRDVVRHAVDAVAALLTEKGQSVTVKLTDELPFQGDGRRLEHALINLVANAHEHTPADTRIVLASRVTADDVLLTVSDDGPGIPDDAHVRIFDRFYQFNPANSKGSGLGLTVAKRIVELHGGRLWVESTARAGRGEGAPACESAYGRVGTKEMKGIGTTFCLALPCRRLEKAL